MYDAVKLIHVLAAIVWTGGGIVTQLFAIRMKTAQPQHRLGFARDLVFVGQRIYAPAAVVSLVFGVWMVLDKDLYEFSQTWLVIGLIGLFATAAIATGFMIPQTKRAIGLIEAGNGPAAAPIVGRVGAGGRVATAILVVVVWAMIFKPGYGGGAALFGTLKLVHVLAVMTWFGGGVISTVFVRRMKGADPMHRLGFVRDEEKLSAVYGMASLVAAAAGIWMVIDRPDYAFGQAWIIIGIVGLVLSGAVGGALLGPSVKKLRAELESGSSGDVGMQRLGRIAILDQTILLIVVWAMVFRPGV